MCKEAVMLPENEAAAIKALASSVDQAALAGDWPGLVGLFEEDCTVMPPNGSEIHGRSAFSTFIESMGLKVYTHSIEFHDVDGHEDLAFARGKYSESFTVSGTEGTIEDSGKVLATLRRQADGSWKFSRWMWNSDLPTP
jgi:uncharacterized protein (TIGR02246 family)